MALQIEHPHRRPAGGPARVDRRLRDGAAWTTLAAVLVSGVLAAVGPGPAQASTITLGLQETTTLTRMGTRAGVPLYGRQGPAGRTTFAVRLLDDAGAPVTGCLGAGGAVEVVTAGGRVVAVAPCTDGAGTFLLVARTALTEPGPFLARITAPTVWDAGGPVSPAQSSTVVLMIAPTLTDTTRVGSGTDGSHRISGTVEMAKPASRGTVVLTRREGRTWRRIGAQRPTRSGRYAFEIPTAERVTRLRVRFVPRDRGLWLPARYTLRVEATPPERELPLPRAVIGDIGEVLDPHHCCHAGVDLQAPPGTPIHAVEAGRVTVAGPAGGFGSHAVVVSGEDGWRWLYGHGSAHLVRVGQTVRAGQVIGRVGSEGQSTGPHLHLSLTAPGESATSAGVCAQRWLAAVWRGVTPPAKSSLGRGSCIGGAL